MREACANSIPPDGIQIVPQTPAQFQKRSRGGAPAEETRPETALFLDGILDGFTGVSSSFLRLALSLLRQAPSFLIGVAESFASLALYLPGGILDGALDLVFVQMLPLRLVKNGSQSVSQTIIGRNMPRSANDVPPHLCREQYI